MRRGNKLVFNSQICYTVNETRTVQENMSLFKYVDQPVLYDGRSVEIKGYTYEKFFNTGNNTGTYSWTLVDKDNNTVYLVDLNFAQRDMFTKNTISAKLYRATGTMQFEYYLPGMKGPVLYVDVLEGTFPKMLEKDISVEYIEEVSIRKGVNQTVELRIGTRILAHIMNEWWA